MTSTMPPPLLDVQQLSHHYRLPRRQLWRAPDAVVALSDISLQVHAGRSLGVVGESGSGKSTLARLIMALDQPTSGHIRLLGQDLSALTASELRAHRRHFQMVFQDPYGSLNPRQTVARTVAEPLEALGTGSPERRQRVAEVLGQVGLRNSDLDKYPHEFSGGQRQRIAIARALITRPQLIVADEPVSALDVSVQAQVLNLMQQLQKDSGVTFVLISHDLAVVQQLCQDVVVLHRGRIVERGSPEQLFTAPQHPYTSQLVQAVPRIAPGLARVRRQARAAAAAKG
ncbi:MAG: ATP-binding cassette domain-containing protein [Acidovorax sp.]|nr:ATP-binding cassette domain-containing protein [Acidovorax sp.]